MIAFCTTAKGRTGHITQTLARNLADNATYPDCKFIVLGYANTGPNCDSDGLIDYIRAHHMPDIESGRLVFYSYPCDGPFEMAKAKNIVHRCGLREGADVLVNLDADNFTFQGFAESVSNHFSDLKNRDTFLAAKVIPGQGRQFRGCSGRICVTSAQFLNAGGYDERYTTYAPDDKDFNRRLQRLGYAAVEIDPRYFRCVPHNDAVRFREYPHVRELVDDYEKQLADGPDATIVNFGNVGCGTVYRNFSDKPITLGRIPTRIFGIGLHKTATNSLTSALRILGFDASHWESPRKARNIWFEMKDAGRSLTIERHYATSDLPVSILYRELDAAYPGSKFVLTVRPEQEWLNSVRSHWDTAHNPWRASWDTDCFTNRIHTEVYGRKSFDEKVFLERYRKHNEDVYDYFLGRPGDLLCMDMGRFGDGWPALCGFLGKIVPNVPYPREYVTL